MRTLKIVVALLLVLPGLTGCGLFGHDSGQPSDEQIQKILDGNASFTVFLRSEVTEAQRKDVETALRALPGTTGVTFIDHDAAYRQMKQLFSAEPSRMPQIEPEILPESFKVAMATSADVRKVRDNQSTVKNLPGVQDVVFTCLTVPECRETFSRRPTTSPS